MVSLAIVSFHFSNLLRLGLSGALTKRPSFKSALTIGARSEVTAEASCESAAAVTATPHSLQSYLRNSGSSSLGIALAIRIGWPQLGHAGAGIVCSAFIQYTMTVRGAQTVMEITFSTVKLISRPLPV